MLAKSVFSWGSVAKCISIKELQFKKNLTVALLKEKHVNMTAIDHNKRSYTVYYKSNIPLKDSQYLIIIVIVSSCIVPQLH